MFLRLTCRGRTIEHNVNGWRQEADSINTASGNSGWTLDPASARWSGVRTLTYALVCERSTRAGLMDQLALAQQLINAINVSSNMWGDRDRAELRAARAGTTVFAMPTSARIEIASIEQTASGWLGRVRLTLETPDPWLLAEPPTSGGSSNNADRIVRNSITEWTPMAITFATNDHAPSPITWTARHASLAVSPELWAIGRYDSAAQRASISTWRCTDAGSETITTGAEMNLVTVTTFPPTLTLYFDRAPFFNSFRHYAATQDVWLCADMPTALATIDMAVPSGWVTVLVAQWTRNFHLGRIAFPHDQVSQIRVTLSFPTMYSSATITALVLTDAVDASTMKLRGGYVSPGPITTGWMHRAVRFWREHRVAAGGGALSDSQLYTQAAPAWYVGASDPLAYPSSVAVCGTGYAINTLFSHVICRRAIAHVSE